MIRKVTVDLPTRPQGEELHIPSIGVVANGSSITVDIDAATAKTLAGGFGITVSKGSGKAESESETENDEGGDD